VSRAADQHFMAGVKKVIGAIPKFLGSLADFTLI
jgi:hypothetical protein